MSEPIFIDLETRSACDLKEYGSYNYATDPTTRLLTVAWRDRGQDHLWFPGLTKLPPDAFVRLHLPGVLLYVGPLVPAPLCRVAGRPWVGHNSWTFDRLVWNECTEGFEHVKWLDTYPMALACGLPGGLDKIGQMLWGEGKYEQGKESLKKAMKATCLDCDPENVPMGTQILVGRYNVQDVRLTEALWNKLKGECKLPESEQLVKAAHDTINTRGVKIDRPFVEELIRLSEACKESAVERIRDLTDGALPDLASIQSRNRILDWLDSQGATSFRVSGLRKEIVARYVESNKKHEDIETGNAEEDTGYEDPDAECEAPVDLARVVKVLELRMQALRITGGKLATALKSLDPDDRARFLFVYWGAHTGRWAGRRIQVQNLPRPKDGVDVWDMIALWESDRRLEYDAIKSMLPLGVRGADGKLLYPFLSVDDAASALLRSIFIPDTEDDALAAADLANIEARVLAWCAGESWLMDAFWAGDDPYLHMAERIVGPRDKWPVYHDPKTGKPLPIKKHPYRQIVGKVPELAAGYQVGGDKLTGYAASMGFNLADYGVTGKQCVFAYRKSHPAIAGEYCGEGKHGTPVFRGGLWYDLQQASIMAVRDGVKTYAGRCTFHMEGTSLIVTLPSGRRLTYRKAFIKNITSEVPYPVEDGRQIFTVAYWSPRYGIKYMYGGKWAENIVQAISRDVLAFGITLLEAGHMPVVLHVHDEAVSSIPGRRPRVRTRYNDFMRCMTTPPDWLVRFPLDAEGSLSPRYAKSPPPGVKDQVWRNGKVK